MKDTKCPYCGADVEINHDDGYGYEEDKIYEQDSPECEKVFTYTTWISFSYETTKADCLNGGEHDYKKTLTYPVRFAKMRCSVCGHERPLTAKELE